MKLGRNGFMLVEVVVVSAVIATVLVTMFIAINRVSSSYSTRDSYNSVDALYLAMAVNDILRENNDLSDLVCNNSNANEITDSNPDSNFESLKEAYKDIGSINLYYSPYDRDKVLSLKKNKATFDGFIDYISNKLDYSNTNYNYLIISELCKTEDDCYYYALKLKYDTSKCG